MDSYKYFLRRKARLPAFWRRLHGPPELTGRDVLDFGAGHCELAIDMAERGARAVVAVDLNGHSLARARSYLGDWPEDIRRRIDIRCVDIRDLPEDVTFDVVASRDVFEHVLDIEQLFPRLIDRLRPGGRFYTGFGPLYRSPFGGHKSMRMPLPWLHLLLPERLLVRWINLFRPTGDAVGSIAEFGLNRRRLADFERVIANEARVRTVYWRVNHGERATSRLFALMCRIRPLREYFAHDIYCILERIDGPGANRPSNAPLPSSRDQRSTPAR
jgi:SAM-dependent methyltransferase